MGQQPEGTPLRRLTTYGRTHAVRLPDFDYASPVDIHVTLCARRGMPFADAPIAAMVCENVEFYCHRLTYRLYGYCLMPDHLHVLLSPAASGQPLGAWLRDFKSYTTRRDASLAGDHRLWQESAYDHVCRTDETAEVVLRYIVENPIRAGFVGRWQDWRWTKVFVTL